MPNSLTMLSATRVARARSPEAPVEISPNTISSAALPPSSPQIWA